MKQLSLRNIIAAIAALFINLLPSAAQTNDSQRYPIWICGTQVTTNNMEHITGPGISGIVSFDAERSVLRLQKATLTAVNIPALKSKVQGLTIELAGPNFVDHKLDGSMRPASAVLLEGKTVIAGSDLSVTTASAKCAAMEIAPETTVMLKECNLDLQGYYGVLGDTLDCTSVLIVDASNLSINKEAYNVDDPELVLGNSISGLSELALKNCAVVEPSGVWFFAHEGYAAYADGNAVCGRLIVSATELYGIRVAGVEVTSLNCEEITAPGIEGAVRFDFTEKTLEMRDATVRHHFLPAVEVYGHDIARSYRIRVHGMATLASVDSPALLASAALHVVGNGLLKTYSENAAAINIHRTHLDIKDSEVIAEGRMGIYGESVYVSVSTLAITNSDVRAKGASGSVAGLALMNMDGCSVFEPDGGYFEERGGFVANADGSMATGLVHIKRTTTDIEQKVDGVDKADIHRIDGVKVKASAVDMMKGVYIVDGKKQLKR